MFSLVILIDCLNWFQHVIIILIVQSVLISIYFSHECSCSCWHSINSQHNSLSLQALSVRDLTYGVFVFSTDEKQAYYSYQASLKYEKEAELLQAHIMDHAINNAISYLGTNALRPLVHHPTLSVTDIVPIVNPLYAHMNQLGPQMEQANRQTVLPQPSIQLDSPSSINSSLSLIRPKNSLTNQEKSPCNSGTESATFNCNSLQDRPGSSSNHISYLRYSTTAGKEEVLEVGPGCMDAPFDHCITRNVYRVFSREGKEMRTFKCEHCHMLFLDHVMYTIHMGCHGYRNPLECNVCGRCSQDRYEFSSHIVRGEHIFH